MTDVATGLPDLSLPPDPDLRAGLRAALDHLGQAAVSLGEIARAMHDGLAIADARAVAAEVAALRMAMLPEVVVGGIVEQVAAQFGLDPARILSARRDRVTVRARWVVMQVARARGLSLAKIGAALGMDHTSVMHGLAQVEALLAQDGRVAG
jgi:chromosomal replication initiation ATPase DnaA